MSFAWGTILLLVFIQPGLVFLFGMYSLERYSRDIGRRSPFGELAMATMAAMLAHTLIYALASLLAVFWSELDFLSSIYGTLSQFTSASNPRIPSPQLVIKWIAGATVYLALLSLISFFVGQWTGKHIITGKLRFLAQHNWIYSLLETDQKKDVFPIAYVMTKIDHVSKNNKFIIMYKGYLKEFYISPNGHISYLILQNCARYFLKIQDDEPIASNPAKLREITSQHAPTNATDSGEWPYLMIEGEEIANVVFDRTNELRLTKSAIESLEGKLEEIARKIDDINVTSPSN